jgi:hypothetical protein
MRTTSHKLDEEDNLDEDDKLDLAQIENPLVVCEWEIDIATVDSVEDSNTTRANTTRVRRRPDIQVTVNIHKQTELPVHPTTTKEIANAFLKMLRYSIGGNPQARKLVRDLIEEVLPINSHLVLRPGGIYFKDVATSLRILKGECGIYWIEIWRNGKLEYKIGYTQHAET